MNGIEQSTLHGRVVCIRTLGCPAAYLVFFKILTSLGVNQINVLSAWASVTYSDNIIGSYCGSLGAAQLNICGGAGGVNRKRFG